MQTLPQRIIFVVFLGLAHQVSTNILMHLFSETEDECCQVPIPYHWCDCLNGCFNHLKDWKKRNEKLLNFIIKMALYVAFNLALNAWDTGTDFWAAVQHFR